MSRQDDINRLAALYREIHAEEKKLRDDTLAFERMTRDLAGRLGVSEDRIGELIAEQHDG